MTTDDLGHGPGPAPHADVGLLAVQGAAILVGSLMLVLGIAGFVPGVTDHLNELRLSGPASGAELLGVFTVSVLQNGIHLAVGLAGLVLYRSYARARAYLLVGGFIYLAIWLYGLSTEQRSPANLVGANTADTWLHFGFGLAMLVLAVTLAGARVPRGARGEVLAPPAL
jgi:hypothetical protein